MQQMPVLSYKHLEKQTKVTPHNNETNSKWEEEINPEMTRRTIWHDVPHNNKVTADGCGDYFFI